MQSYSDICSENLPAAKYARHCRRVAILLRVLDLQREVLKRSVRLSLLNGT
jgi:hypothetical protein